MAGTASGTPKAVNPIWLFPAGVTVAAFYEKAFVLGGRIAELCVSWVDFAREVWLRLFGMTPLGAPDGRVLDLLTLWLTCSVVAIALPRATGERGHVPKTTTGAVRDLTRLPALPARIVAFVLIIASIALIAFPFSAPLQAAAESDILMPGGTETRVWLGNEARWLAYGLIAVGLVAVGFGFFIQNPRVEALDLNEVEKRDISIISIMLWLASAAFLVLAFLIPSAGWQLGSVHVGAEESIALSLLGLACLIAWRSALPFVQLALLVVAFVVLDRVYTFLSGVWAATMS